ncbi:MULTISPECIES: CGLD27 family protein [unclassified Leptolyngbya]|uniref:CGLD27 family protein n=1 Tax=unclassified Leptolyngbya TaxID=2650499 RepID=UPI001687072F|nr:MULTISPECIES: CGLD27 family protein [unclassified Leptolyngbya]MBD1913576.1 CGLD27 family protein [Leptolyngbya sp. FACHB-8]MBD2155853.1 CGLD27 family protein [Leptolyngbya sp. FACHB-16]
MKSSAPVCPVPTEQQPINEFRDLTESWFFRWATLDWWPYVKPLIVLWSLSWVIVWPVAAISFPPVKDPGHFFVCGVVGACALPLLALSNLALGWLYVRDRLRKETIFYEESGWYDGQTWTKPEEVLQRDRLIVSYQISPIMQRLRRTFLFFVGLFLACVFAWLLLP